MAPKPKKITDADKARLKKLAAGKGALANGKLSMDQKLELQALKRMDRQSKSYSPAPMSAAAKKKAAAQGKKMAESTLKKNLKPLNNDKTSKAPKKPLVETNRIGGIISVPKKPKKEIY